ncbi:hypothetical protein Syun_014537 [Stephania yunnanensis]|uniref:Rhodanese domain-containing protein n=1 Tax=Stephania yunnanensis TaxID=152371 RepID=A0AAP0JJS0_9MAGN
MELALRASAAPSPASTSRSHPHKSYSLIKPTPPSTQFKPISVSLPTTSAALSLLALFTSPNDAKALAISKDQIMSSITQVESVIEQAQEAGSGVLGFSQRVFQVVIEALKPGVEAAVPVLKKAGDKALEIASPAVSEASKMAEEAMTSSGIDPDPVVETMASVAQQTTKVIDVAKSIAVSAVEIISSSEPVVIVDAVGAVFLTSLLLPPIWSVISYGLRGYKGTFLVSIQLPIICWKRILMKKMESFTAKDRAGNNRVPFRARIVGVMIRLEELPSKLRGIVRNSKKVEAEIIALKISYLKRISTRSYIVIMDSYCDTAKTVAKALTSLGLKNSWVLVGGFSGGKGWTQSRLGTDSYNVTFAEVLTPSRIIPAAVKSFSATSSTATAVQGSQKLLPGNNQ